MVLPVIIMMPLSKIRQFQPKYTCSDKKNESLFYVVLSATADHLVSGILGVRW